MLSSSESGEGKKIVSRLGRSIDFIGSNCSVVTLKVVYLSFLLSPLF